MTTSTFIFRIARVTAPKGKKVDCVDLNAPQQLVLGEYYNKKTDKLAAGARLHWGQHYFMKGLFYIFKFADGSYTDSFNRNKNLEMHVDVSINYEAHHIKDLVSQLEGISETVCNPPKAEHNVSDIQDQYQLHIEVSPNAVAEVSEYFARKNGEVDRLTVRIQPKDIVSFKVVHSSDDAFKASVGGTSVKLDTLMEGLFGKAGVVDSLNTVEDVRARFCTATGSKKRKSRRNKKDINSASNEVVTESTQQEQKPEKVIVAEDEATEEAPL